MDIEITTTKRKLTKAHVNQMRQAPLSVLKEGNVLGYMVKVVKNQYRTILIERAGEYFVISANWQKGESSVYLKIGKWSQSKKFDGIVECGDWWRAYNRALEAATTQIYI